MVSPDNDPYKAPNADLDAPTPAEPTDPATRLNPWFSIWIRPRATIQQIVDTDPKRFVLMIAMLSGINGALDRASYRSVGDHLELGVLLLLALLAGPLAGLVYLYLGSALLRVTGGWLGGEAPAGNLRAAMAWGSVPGLVGLALWLPQLAIFGGEMFTSAAPTIESSMTLVAILIAFAAASVVLAVWNVVLTVKCVGQVQGFTAWRALGSIVLAALLLFVPLIVLGVVVTLALV